jgi:predicted GIY-YIG superfamily endonuclease
MDRTALYRFFGADGALLYVGITMSPVTRFRTHSKESAWWVEVDHSRTLVEWLDCRDLASAAEQAAIKTEAPRYNVAGLRGFGGRKPVALNSRQLGLLRVAAESVERARQAEHEAWDAALAARNAGVPDTVLCEETSLSRATLNRKYGPRQNVAE